MLNLEEIITKILFFRTDLTTEVIQEMIQSKKKSAGGLLTDEGAAYMVANELGVKLSDEITLKTKIGIKDLIIGANDVTITGSVETIYPVTEFVRNNGLKGKVAKLVVSDETGRINVALWDETAEMMNRGEISKNQTIRVNHGYVRTGLNGRPELNIGKRGYITVLSSESNINKSFKAITKIAQLNQGMMKINVLGRVVHVGRVKEFVRSSSKTGKVGNLFLMNGTGSKRLALWNGKADFLEKISIGDVVLVEGAYTRKHLTEVELNLGRKGSLTINPELKEANTLPPLPTEAIPIAQLKMGWNLLVEGDISKVPTVRNVMTRDGREIKVASFNIQDLTGEVQVSLWGELADKVSSLPLEAKFKIKNGYVRIGFNGNLELTSRFITEIEVYK